MRKPTLLSVLTLISFIGACGLSQGEDGAKSLPLQGLWEGCSPTRDDGDSRSGAACLDSLNTMAAAGFRLVANYGNFDALPEDIRRYADRAASLGMKVVWAMNASPYRNGVFDESYVNARVNAVATHTATWGYYIADEPSITLITSPTSNSTVLGTSTATAWAFVHSANGTFDNLQFLLDGKPLGDRIRSLSSESYASVRWDTTQVPDGPHLLQARSEYTWRDSGVRTTATSEPVYITVRNGGSSGSLRVTTAAVPDGGVKASYAAIVSATGGAPPYRWRLSAGSLPGGLTLNPDTGVISGILTQAGQPQFTIEVQDSAPAPAVAVGTFTVSISASSLEEQALVRNLSERVRRLDPDPTHLRFLVHFQGGSEEADDQVALLRPFADAADVLAIDVYTTAVAGLRPSIVSVVARALKDFGDRNGKPWGVVLQSFDGEENYPGDGYAPGWPSVARMREERDRVLASGNPAFILWYSYFDIMKSSNPTRHWADLVAAAFSPIPALRRKPVPLPIRESTPTRPATPPSKNAIRSIRSVPSGVEIEVTSNKEFPVRNELVALRIGAQEFTLSRYPGSGDIHTLIFTLTPGEFAKTVTGDLVTVQYGRGGKSNEQWNFGALDKEGTSPSRSSTPTPAPAVTPTIHVSVNGSDSGNGSASAPFRSIAKGLAALKPGRVLQIGAGTYQTRLVPTVSGTVEQPIVIQGEPGAEVIIDGTGLKHEEEGLVHLERLSYVTLRGLTVRNSSYYGVTVFGSDHIVVEKNTIEKTRYGGLLFFQSAWNEARQVVDNHPCAEIKALDNELRSVALLGPRVGMQEGISVSAVDGFEVANNRLDDIHTEGICIKDGSKNGKVHHNTVSRTAAVGLYLNHATRVEMFKNRVTASKTTGIFFATGDGADGAPVTTDNRVYQNVVVDCEDGCAMWKEKPGDLTRNLVFNNVFCHNTNNGILLQSAKINGNTFRNNIIVGGQYDGFSDERHNANTVSHNLYFKVTEGREGANAVIADPLFVNPEKGDFSLKAESPAIDAGFDMGLPKAGKAPDIGAFEYGAGTQ